MNKYVDTIILIFYDGFFLIDTSLFLVAIAVLLLLKMPSLNQKFPRSKIKFNYVQVLNALKKSTTSIYEVAPDQEIVKERSSFVFFLAWIYILFFI